MGIKNHRDDIPSLGSIISCDDYELIKKIGNWEIELNLDKNFIEDKNYPH